MRVGVSAGCIFKLIGWSRAGARYLAAAALGMLFLCGCASPSRPGSARVTREDFPAPEFVPRHAIMQLAETQANGSASGFVFVTTTDELLPRYPAGTVFVAERRDYAGLRSGEIVIFRRGVHRVARVLEQATPAGWLTSTFDGMEDEARLMTPNTYLGTVVKAFAPAPEGSSP